ncbi:MAG TPA: hypothetical protein VLE91_03700 [Candidatus Saccharimonadales bacterium]|nr:hypothetical protein [Candidatus Saccharimonadales bacterium]
MIKDMFKGFLDWYLRTSAIKISLTLLGTVIISILDHYKLLPKEGLLQYIFATAYLALYISLFILVIIFIYKKQSKKNLDSLISDVNKLKTKK